MTILLRRIVSEVAKFSEFQVEKGLVFKSEKNHLQRNLQEQTHYEMKLSINFF